MLATRMLALAVALLVLWRVVATSVATLLAPTVAVVAAATGVLLLAAVPLVATAAAYAATGSARTRGWFAGSLTAYVVVMAGYLLLGLALGAHVPWTAYAVLVGVVALGGGALAVGRPSVGAARVAAGDADA